MRKTILTWILVLFSTMYSYSQIDSEYQEGNFNGSEEVSYNPKNEVFIITSGMISNKHIVFDKSLNKNSYWINVDYEKNILTIKMGKTSDIYTFEIDDNEYYWGDMPQYYLLQGYLYKKNEKSSFIVESGANGNITLTIDKNLNNRHDLYRAGLQKNN